MIIPTLPTLAELQIRDHQSRGLPAFHRIIEYPPQADRPGVAPSCQNCAGLGVVYVQFAKAGPFSSPNGGLVTWYEGDGVIGKGFYQIEKTEAYQCPVCKGVR